MLARARHVEARLFPHGFMDVVKQVLLFLLAYNAYRLVRGGVDNASGAAAAFEHARRLIGLERGLHTFIEPSVQAWASAKPALIDAASWTYVNAQTSITIGALIFIYVFHNERFYFVRNMFMVAMGIALIGYMVYPTAPPRFFPEWGFIDSVSDLFGVDHQSSVNALFNPYAAVPSMHVAFALMIGVTLARVCRWRAVRVFWALYPLLVTFVIVATGNHFLADAFFGACTAGIAAYAAAWLARARPHVWAFSPAKAGVRAGASA
jgi:hypothetical protein